MPKRIQRKRTAGWRMPEGAVYVGRPTHWGNLYRTDRPTVWGVSEDGNRYRIDRVLTPAEAVELYRISNTWGDWLPVFTRAVRRDLAGKDLACWCPLDQPCHADVLLEVANPAAARPVGNCVGCTHNLKTGPCGGCGAVAEQVASGSGSKLAGGGPA